MTSTCIRTTLFAAVLATAFAGPAMAQAIKIRLAHATGNGHPFDIQALMFKEAVEKKLPGKVEVQVFGNRQLGDDRQVLEATIAGSIDASVSSSVNFPLVVKKPAFDALQIPFLISSYDHLALVLPAQVTSDLLTDLDSVGLKGLSIGDGGLRHFLSSKGAVKSLADFKGLKTRIVPVPLHKAMWEAVGTSPVGMAYGEVYTSLQTKVIDAVEINISSAESENLWEAAKYMTLTGHYFWPAVLTYNKAKFDKLPPEVQKALLDAGREIIRPQIAAAAKNESEKSEILKKRGLNISSFPDLAKMRETMKPIVDQWSAKDPKIAAFIAYARQVEKK